MAAAEFQPLSVFPTCFSMRLGYYDNKDTDVNHGKFLYMRGGHVKGEDYAAFGETGRRDDLTSSMHTRFYLVPSRVNAEKQLAHIRCSYNNKYLTVKKIKFDFQQRDRDSGEVFPINLVVDTADEQDEDLSKESCTLFKISDDTSNGRPQFRFWHYFFNTPTSFVVTPDETKTAEAWDSFRYPCYVDLVDVMDQIILPPYLSFKDHNGFYLAAVDIDDRTHLEFAPSAKKDDKSVIFSSLNYPDGQVCIKSELVGRYLLYCSSLIKAEWESLDDDAHGGDVFFKALKVGDFFVLQCMSNNLFCTASKQDNRELLDASATSITDKEELTIEEPILSREIYNIQPHRSDQARNFDTTDIKMATATAYNETSEKNTVKSSMSITTTASSKHDSTSTHKAFGEVSVSGGFKWGPVDTSVTGKVGYEYTDAQTWGSEDTTEKKQDIEYEVTVPANRKVTLTVTAKEVKRDIPFSYTQKDRLHSGKFKIYDYDDGLYTGVDCFDLSYTTKEEEIEPKKEENESSKKRKG